MLPERKTTSLSSMQHHEFNTLAVCCLAWWNAQGGWAICPLAQHRKKERGSDRSTALGLQQSGSRFRHPSDGQGCLLRRG